MRTRVVTSLAVCLFAGTGLCLCALCSAGELVITGTVVTPDGQPAAGATVFCDYAIPGVGGGLVDIRAETTSGPDGSFEVHLPSETALPDRYSAYITASMDGYGFGYAWAPAGDDAPLTLRLHGERPIAGVVMNQDGHPLVGAEVWLEYVQMDDDGTSRGNTHVQATTDNEGRFELHGAPTRATTYLAANADGYQRVVTQYGSVAQLNGIVITLPQEAVITGSITRRGEPVAGVVVCAEAGGLPSGHGTAVSDAGGIYRIDSIAPGRYSVVVPSCDQPDAVTDLVAAPRTNVECEIGEPATGIDFELVEGGVVTGSVLVAQTGEPVPDADVWASYLGPDDGPPCGYWSTRASATGACSLRLPPGNCHLSASAREYVAVPEDEGTMAVTVTDGQPLRDVGFAMDLSERLGGVVVDEHGDPVPGAVYAWHGYKSLERRTDAQGRFPVSTSSAHYPLRRFFVHAGRGLAACGVITDGTADTRIELVPGGYITGAVVDPAGDPVVNAPVAAEYIASAEPELAVLPPAPTGVQRVSLPRVETDAGGAFRLGPLPTDVDISVYVSGETGRFVSEHRWPDAARLARGQTVDLGPTVVDLGGRTLTGRVMDVDRNLLAGCEVTEYGTGSTTRSDESGRFELTGVPYLDFAGSFNQAYCAMLLVVYPTSRCMCAVGGIEVDWDHNIDMVVEPLGAVRGRGVDAEGRPIAGASIMLGAGGRLPQPMTDPYATLRWGARLHAETETDGNGAWEFGGLIPGLGYYASGRQGSEERFVFHEGFTTKPGETIDLRDLQPPAEDGGQEWRG